MITWDRTLEKKTCLIQVFNRSKSLSMSEKHKDRKFLGVLIRTNHKATSIRSMLEGTLKSKYNACRHCSKSGGLAGSAPARSPRWLAEDSHKFRTRLWTAVRSVERRRKRAWQLLGGEKKLGPAQVCVIHNTHIYIYIAARQKQLLCQV